jgi:hypothetical protein
MSFNHFCKNFSDNESEILEISYGDLVAFLYC